MDIRNHDVFVSATGDDGKVSSLVRIEFGMGDVSINGDGLSLFCGREVTFSMFGSCRLDVLKLLSEMAFYCGLRF